MIQESGQQLIKQIEKHSKELSMARDFSRQKGAEAKKLR